MLQTIEAYYSGAATGSVPIEILMAGTQLETDSTLSWLASALVNTVKYKDWAVPTNQTLRVAFEVTNSSTVTNLIVTLYNLESLYNTEIASCLVPVYPVAILDTGEAAWTQVDAQCTVTADAVIYKTGTHSAKMAMAANAAVGVQAYKNFTTVNCSIYTHFRFWIYSTVALDANDFKIQVSSTDALANVIENFNIPAIAANTWTQVVTTTLVNRMLFYSVMSIGLYQTVDKGALDIYIDDFSAMKINTKLIPVDYAFLGGVQLRQTIENDTVLGANDAFSAITRLRVV